MYLGTGLIKTCFLGENLKILVGPGKKIQKIYKRRAFNKAVGPLMKSKIINVGPTTIPQSRVMQQESCIVLYAFRALFSQ